MITWNKSSQGSPLCKVVTSPPADCFKHVGSMLSESFINFGAVPRALWPAFYLPPSSGAACEISVVVSKGGCCVHRYQTPLESLSIDLMERES